MAKAKPTKPTVRTFGYSVSLAITLEKANEATGLAAIQAAVNGLKTQPGFKTVIMSACELTTSGCARCGAAKHASQLVTLLNDKYCTTCLGDLITNEG
jgi:protein gp37